MALFPIPVLVEILINGTWADISAFVYQRDSIQITGGKADQGSSSQPAQAALTLDNRDGRFSPKYAGGPYYPYLTRNVQLRISVQGAVSASGNTYSGYRFWGEVAAWPPASDVSGNDVYVHVTANGPLRRIRTGGGEGSALTRYYNALTGAYAPIAYWPCEEDPDADIIGAGIDGGTNMTVTTGTPKWKSISDFNGSAPIAVLNNSTWDGLTGSYGSGSGDDVYVTPGTYSWVCPAGITAVNVKCHGGGGGGANGGNRTAGGGGEFAQDTAVAVTPGNSYTLVVAAGGQGGSGAVTANNPGTDGDSTTFTGDAVTVTAHGGKGGTTVRAAGGTGSTNAVHHDGGAGGMQTGGGLAGGGGGGSGGTAAAGNGGGDTSSNTHGAGAAAVTGGGAGGDGGDAGTNTGAKNGGTPGGGGGGGYINPATFYQRQGGDGGAGRAEVTYTPVSVPNNNVIRFILFVPAHGGNNGKVILRALTGGTVAKLEVSYVSQAKLRLQGYNSGGSQIFDSGAQAFPILGLPFLVSVELVNSGANVAWKFTGIVPGASQVFATYTGTVSGSVGNVTEVLAGPNADITKTGLGHISVQYALIDVTRVSRALNGHHTEMGIDRFVRLCNEQALAANPEFSETNDRFSFESGTQSWVGVNASLTSSTTSVSYALYDTKNPTIFTGWPPDGTHSLRLSASGAGQPSAYTAGGAGTGTLFVNAGDIVSVNAEFYAPAALNNVFVGIKWSNGTTILSETDCSDTAFTAGQMQTLSVKDTAPTGATKFSVIVGNHHTDTAGTLLYVDNVRIHPRMGPQTRKKYHEFLTELERLDRGMLKDAKIAFGLGYRTRLTLINQSPAVTLDYSQGHISPPLQPVVDDLYTLNDITVHRHKGSRVRVTLDSGTMSVQEPPAGAGRYRHRERVVAEVDEQLLAFANWLLLLHTVDDERYPTITVNLARCANAALNLAPLMSAVAAVDIGDFVKITNLPFWYPNTTAQQLVIGYSETLGPREWTITWNCQPASPYSITASSIRRW